MRLSNFYRAVRRATAKGQHKWFFAIGAIRSMKKARREKGHVEIACFCPISAVWHMHSGKHADHALASRRLGLTDAQQSLLVAAIDKPMRYLDKRQQQVRHCILAAIGR